MRRLQAKKQLHGLSDSDEIQKCLAELNTNDALISSQYTFAYGALVLLAASFGAAWHHGGLSLDWPVLPGVLALAFAGVSLLVGSRHVPAKTLWHFGTHEERERWAEQRARQVGHRAFGLYVAVIALVVAAFPVVFAVAATFDVKG